MTDHLVGAWVEGKVPIKSVLRNNALFNVLISTKECSETGNSNMMWMMGLGCCVDKTKIIKAFVESLMHFQSILKKITYYNGHFGEIIIEIYVLHCPALLRWE